MSEIKKDLTNKAISLIFSVSRIMRVKNIKNHPQSLSRLKIETLRYIKENIPLMREMADFLCIAPPSATSIIDHLVESNLVRRVNDKEDRRSVRLQITRHGETKLNESTKALIHNMKKILEPLDMKEKNNLTGILEKIIQANNN